MRIMWFAHVRKATSGILCLTLLCSIQYDVMRGDAMWCDVQRCYITFMYRSIFSANMYTDTIQCILISTLQ